MSEQDAVGCGYRQTERHTHIHTGKGEIDRSTDIETENLGDRQVNSQTDRHINIPTGRQTDRPTVRQTNV